MRNLILAFLMFSGSVLAASKPLKPLTNGCFEYDDLKIAPFEGLSKGIRIYSNNAEFEMIFKNVGCVNPNDVWACEYEETYSGSYQGHRKPYKATLYPSRYDLELNGKLYLLYPSGRVCKYEIAD